MDNKVLNRIYEEIYCSLTPLVDVQELFYTLPHNLITTLVGRGVSCPYIHNPLPTHLWVSRDVCYHTTSIMATSSTRNYHSGFLSHDPEFLSIELWSCYCHTCRPIIIAYQRCIMVIHKTWSPNLTLGPSRWSDLLLTKASYQTCEF